MSTEKAATYIRRRAFNKIHVTSWLIYLEKDGVVRCPFQNCNFMAFDVDEMCEHYGFCKGENSFAKYVCEFCNGCTTSEKKLQLHKSQSHNITSPIQADAKPEPKHSPSGRPSRALQMSWNCFFDKFKYIKCPNCQFVANTMTDMRHHYSVCKEQKELLLYVCPECKGRTSHVNPLIWHMERAHKINRLPNHFNLISKAMVQYWERELIDKKFATCLHITNNHRDCHFIDIDLIGIIEHSQSCKGPKNINSVKQCYCEFCTKWTDTDEKLKKHVELSHLKKSHNSVGRDVKQETSNTFLWTAAKELSPASKAMRDRGINKSDRKDHVGSVEPLEEVFVKQEVETMEDPEVYNSQITKCLKTAQGNSVKNETSIMLTRSIVYSDALQRLKSFDAEKQRENTGKERSSSNECPESVGKNISDECSITAVCKTDNNNQEIYLDLVEDKLVARRKVTKMKDQVIVEENNSKQSIFNNQDNSCLQKEATTVNLNSHTVNCSPVLKHTINDNSQKIVIVDLDSGETSENEDVKAKHKLQMNVKEITEAEKHALLQSTPDNCISLEYTCATSIKPVQASNCEQHLVEDSSLQNENKTPQSLYEDEQFLGVLQEHSRDVIEAIEVNKETPPETKDSVNGRYDSNTIKHNSKRIKDSCYALFKDELSSDDNDDCGEVNDEKDGIKDIKLCFDWESEKKAFGNKSPKSYSRRPSPVKCTSKSPEYQNSTSASNQYSNGFEMMELAITSNKNGKKSYGKYKTQLESKKNFILQNRVKKFGDSEEESSKNSEKNDKLMLNEDYSSVPNEKSSNLNAHNRTISLFDESNSLPGDERLTTTDISFGFLQSETKSNSCDCKGETPLKRGFEKIDNMDCQSVVNGKNEPESFKNGLSSTSKSLRANESNGIDMGGGERGNNKSETLSCAVDLGVYEREETNKSTEYVDLTLEDSQDSICDVNKSDCLSSDKRKLDRSKGNIKASSSAPKIVSFFYHGKLNRHLLAGKVSATEICSKDENQSAISKFGNTKSEPKSLPNKPSSSQNQVINIEEESSEDEDKSEMNCNSTGTGTYVVTESLNKRSKKFDIAKSIRADFFDESSLEEGSVRTDEELDMTDHGFNGFKEIEENYQSQNRFCQFFKRVSESENEEWYINAGNLAMDVRKDSSLFSTGSQKLGSGDHDPHAIVYNNQTIRKIVTDENTDKDRLEEQTKNNSKKPFGANHLKLIIQKPSKLKYSDHTKTSNTQKNNIVKKPLSNAHEENYTRIIKEVQSLDYSTEENKLSIGDSQSHNNIVSSLVISNAKLPKNISSRFKETNKPSTNTTESNSCLKIYDSSKKDESNEKTDSLNAENNIGHGRDFLKEKDFGKLQKDVNFIADMSVTEDCGSITEDTTRKISNKSFVGKMNNCSNACDKISTTNICRNNLTTSTTPDLQITREATLEETCVKERSVEIINLDHNSTFSDTLHGTSLTGNISGAIVSSTPVKFREGNQEVNSSTNLTEHTIVTSPLNRKSNHHKSVLEDTIDQVGQAPDIIEGDDSTSSGIEKASSLSTRNIDSVKNNFIMENDIIGTTNQQRALHHNLKTHMTELDTINCNKIILDASVPPKNSFNIDVYNEVGKIPKKRGRPKKVQVEVKSQETGNTIADDVVVSCHVNGLNSRRKNSKCEEELTDITNNDAGRGDLIKSREPVLTSLALEKIDLNNSAGSVLPKKRGRPPKRKHIKNDETYDDSLNTSEDFENISENELQLSLYSEEAVSVLESGMFEIKVNHDSKTSTAHCNLSNKHVSKKHSSNSIDMSLTSQQNQTLSCNNTEVKIPKKRGRKPKLSRNKLVDKLNSEITVTGDDFSLDERVIENDLDINTSIGKSSPISEIKVPKKRGRPPKPKLDGSQLVNSSLEIKTDKSDFKEEQLKHDQPKSISEEKSTYIHNEVVLPKKRGRKPKLKPDNSASDENVKTDKISGMKGPQEDIPDFSIINQSNPSVSGYTIQPKKRGRKPKIKVEASTTQHTTNLVNEDFTLDAKNVSGPKRRRTSGKSLFCNKETMSEAASVSDIGEEDLNDSVSGELLGTDIIFINEDKIKSLYSSRKRTRKFVGKPLNETIIEDDTVENKCSSGTEDSDDCGLTPRFVKARRKKIVSEEDYSDDASDSDEKTVKKFIRKTGRGVKVQVVRPKPTEKNFFLTKHSANDQVVCGVCKQEMSYNHYKMHHALFKHYMISWLDGEEDPLDLTNEKDIISRLWYTKKRLGKTPFRCPSCNLPKLSAVGFHSHIKFCGKEDEEKDALLVTCELCGARLMPSSMKPHLYIKHSGTPSSSKVENIDQSVIIPRSRRAAASRAVEVIQKSQTDDQELEEPNSRTTSPERKSYLSQLYKKPSKFVSPLEYQRWKDSLAENNFVACQKPGCNFKCESTVHFRKHFLTCQSIPPLFKCKNCSFTSETEQPMIEHVEENHDSVICHIQESDNESSDGSDQGDLKQQRPMFYSANPPFRFLQTHVTDRRRNPAKRKFFPAALKWTLELRESVFTTEAVFPELQSRLDQWLPLSADSVAPHLPQMTTSMRFRGSDGAWLSLQRFQGCVLDGVPVMFTGGPVWATAWTPVPDSETDQYLAVASHPSAELTHEMASVYNYPSLIQIWSIGLLHNVDSTSTQNSPRLLLGLAHRRGPVWGLAWCPAGAYTEERLGLLAAACGDGSIAVFCVPRLTVSPENSLSTFMSVKPVYELKLGCEMMSQCTSIDWHAVAPHSMIVGGFANGMVALWDLTTTSPLLRDGTTIYPFKVIEAHLSSVTSVKLSWTEEDVHLMTASLDRATKFWKLDDMTIPVSALKKASVMDAVMPNNWMTSISAYDDVYSVNSSHITGHNYRETFTSANCNYILQPGTVWSLSFNDWLNAGACASEMGIVSVFYRHQLLFTEDSKKIKNTAFTEYLMSCSAWSLRDGCSLSDRFGKNYDDCASNVGLDINFKENMNKSKSVSSSNVMDSYPILSVNKVSWNPNMSSFTWLAAGLQCGLVAVPRARTVRAEDLSGLYEHKESR